MFLAMFQYLCGKIVKAKDHIQFYIKFNSENLSKFVTLLHCITHVNM